MILTTEGLGPPEDLLNIFIYCTASGYSPIQQKHSRCNIYIEKVYEAEEKYENTEDAKHALTPTKGHRTCAEARRVLVHARGASYCATRAPRTPRRRVHSRREQRIPHNVGCHHDATRLPRRQAHRLCKGLCVDVGRRGRQRHATPPGHSRSRPHGPPVLLVPPSRVSRSRSASLESMR